MAGVNKVILIGRCGKEPETKRFDNGRAVTNFSMATSMSYKDKQGQKVENTEWHNIVLWSPLSEIAEKYLNKGDQVYIEGKLTTRSYDKSDGTKGYVTEIVGRDLTLLGSAGSNKNDETKGGESIDDLPF